VNEVVHLIAVVKLELSHTQLPKWVKPMSTRESTEPEPLPAVSASRMTEVEDQFARRARNIAAQKSPEQLFARLDTRYSKVKRYMRLTITEIVGIGEDLEALRIATKGSGTYLERLEQFGIRRSTARAIATSPATGRCSRTNPAAWKT
jgi:hypothetical protein